MEAEATGKGRGGECLLVGKAVVRGRGVGVSFVNILGYGVCRFGYGMHCGLYTTYMEFSFVKGVGAGMRQLN